MAIQNRLSVLIEGLCNRYINFSKLIADISAGTVDLKLKLNRVTGLPEGYHRNIIEWAIEHYKLDRKVVLYDVDSKPVGELDLVTCDKTAINGISHVQALQTILELNGVELDCPSSFLINTLSKDSLWGVASLTSLSDLENSGRLAEAASDILIRAYFQSRGYAEDFEIGKKLKGKFPSDLENELNRIYDIEPSIFGRFQKNNQKMGLVTLKVDAYMTEDLRKKHHIIFVDENRSAQIVMPSGYGAFYSFRPITEEKVKKLEILSDYVCDVLPFRDMDERI